MTIDYNLIRHPARHELLAHAENLVDRRAPVSAQLAAHLASCPRCNQEFRALRASLEFVASAPHLQPSNDLTAQILMQAHKERNRRQKVSRRYSTLRVATRGFAYAALLTVIVGFSFNTALNDPDQRNTPGMSAAHSAPPTASFHQQDILPASYSPESIKETANRIRSLTEAVEYAPVGVTPTPQELEQRRAVQQLAVEMEAALEALERNPGSQRAIALVQANFERQNALLRRLYAERTL